MPTEEEFSALQAQLAKLQEGKDAADIKAKEADMKRFEVSFHANVAAGRVLPAEFETQKKVAEAMGVDFAVEQLAARPVAVALSSVGAPPAATPPAPAGGGAGGTKGLNAEIKGTTVIFGGATDEQLDEMLARDYPNGQAAKRVAARRAGGGR